MTARGDATLYILHLVFNDDLPSLHYLNRLSNMKS